MLGELGLGRVGYSAGITATSLAGPRSLAGYVGPSGLAMGGLKVGFGDAKTLLDQAQRLRGGPPVAPDGVVRPNDAPPYMTEGEAWARGFAQKAQAGWAKEDCRPAIFAALALGWLLFRG